MAAEKKKYEFMRIIALDGKPSLQWHSKTELISKRCRQ